LHPYTAARALAAAVTADPSVLAGPGPPAAAIAAAAVTAAEAATGRRSVGRCRLTL